MKFSFDLRIGDRSIRIEEEAADEHEFWRRMAFWDSLPAAGPNGEADLRFSYRTPKGFEYYTLECRSAGMQFDFGQMNKPTKDLFPKSWSQIQHGQREEREEYQGVPAAPSPGPASAASNREAFDAVLKALIDAGISRKEIADEICNLNGGDGYAKICSLPNAEPTIGAMLPHFRDWLAKSRGPRRNAA